MSKEILQYIAASPPHEHGGFHENTIAAAKWALQEIADLTTPCARRWLRRFAERSRTPLEE